jgi:hypothetical protein
VKRRHRHCPWLVDVGDWLLRVNHISCRDMRSDEIKRYIVGPVVTKVVVVNNYVEGLHHVPQNLVGLYDD